jgi:hypothetical protein
MIKRERDKYGKERWQKREKERCQIERERERERDGKERYD